MGGKRAVGGVFGTLLRHTCLSSWLLEKPSPNALFLNKQLGEDGEGRQPTSHTDNGTRERGQRELPGDLAPRITFMTAHYEGMPKQCPGNSFLSGDLKPSQSLTSQPAALGFLKQAQRPIPIILALPLSRILGNSL